MISQQEYQRDMQRVQEEIWNTIGLLQNTKVLDVGAGQSTQLLERKGAKVIAIDIDYNKLKSLNTDADLINADVARLPIRGNLKVDLALFHYTLHEIKPSLHHKVIKEVMKIAEKIVIVEFSPYSNETYSKYAQLWQEAMKSIGKTEEYYSLNYWLNLLKRNSLKVKIVRKIQHKVAIPYEVLKKTIESDVKEWQKQGVPMKIIERLKTLLIQAEEKPMKWSPNYVIVACKEG